METGFFRLRTESGKSVIYKKTNTYNLEHYLIEHFGICHYGNSRRSRFRIWLNNLAEVKDYSESVVRSCFNNIRAITHLARKQKFLTDDPGEDITMPITKVAETPVMSLEQSLSLLGAITDLHDLCLMFIGIFSGPRASEAMGFQWKSWTGESLVPHGTAVEGKFYKGRVKSKASRRPIVVPELVRPVIEAWRRICPDSSPEALMFPPSDVGSARVKPYRVTRRTSLGGASVRSRRKLGIPDRLVTFQVMRRSLGTHMQDHGTLKDTQGALRHASITTTGNMSTCRWSRRASCERSTLTPTRYSMAGPR